MTRSRFKEEPSIGVLRELDAGACPYGRDPGWPEYGP